MVETATGLILHLQDEVQLPLRFIQDVRNAVPALRYVHLIILELIGEELIGPHQIGNSDSTIIDVFPVIASVIPALRDIAGWVDSRLKRGIGVLGMSHSTRVYACMRGIKGNALALVVEVARGIDHQWLIDIVADLEGNGIGDAWSGHRKIVGAGGDERGEI